MSVDRHSKLKQFYEEAMPLDGAGRSAVVREVYRHDESLGDELSALLAVSEPGHVELLDAPLGEVASRLGVPAGGDGAEAEPALALPATLGRYTLTGVLGRGGQGVVYRAQQATPRREVAVKVLGSGVVTPGLARRFAHEAEALGMLTHPGIAQVFDAGTEKLLGVACPYIAMELVEGQRLDRFVQEQRPSMRRVLELVAEIARTVDYAHKRGVIHRDLKPGNIIVSREGQAKVLDFGVARLVRFGAGGAGVSATLSATGHQIVGTLAYMSPEQAGGNPAMVDVRSDVFALGAIGFELLCGRPPRQTDSMSLPAALRSIAETDAPTPRTVVRDLPVEVEAIVVKALARRPEDRYEHASALADDIERYLAGEPVTARRYTRVERLRRVVRRNRLPVAAGAVLVLALAGGTVATSWQAAVARRERQAAQQEAFSARAATDMMRRILTAASPAETRGQDITVRQMLSAAEAELSPDAKQLGDAGKDAYGLATTLATIAETRLALGDYALAEKHARRAMDLLDSTPRGASVAAIENRCTLVRAQIAMGQAGAAQAMARQTLELAGQLGAQSPAHFNARLATIAAGKPGVVLASKEHRVAAVEGYRALLADMRPALPENDPRIDLVRSELAVDLEELGERKEAFRIICEIYVSRKNRLGDDHPDTLLTLHNIATYTGELGRLPPAIVSMTQVIERRGRVLGLTHPSTLFSIAMRAKFLMRMGSFDQALPDIKAVLDARTQRFGPEHRETLTALGLYGTCLLQLKRLDEAGVAIETLVTRARAVYGPRDPATLLALTLAWNLAEAKGDQPEMIAIARDLVGSEHEAPVRAQMVTKGLNFDKP